MIKKMHIRHYLCLSEQKNHQSGSSILEIWMENGNIDITTTSESNYSGPSSDRRRLGNDTSPMHPRAYLVYGGTNKGWEETDNHKSGTPGAC